MEAVRCDPRYQVAGQARALALARLAASGTIDGLFAVTLASKLAAPEHLASTVEEVARINLSFLLTQVSAILCGTNEVRRSMIVEEQPELLRNR